jgi:hypothetical protein
MIIEVGGFSLFEACFQNNPKHPRLLPSAEKILRQINPLAKDPVMTAKTASMASRARMMASACSSRGR